MREGLGTGSIRLMLLAGNERADCKGKVNREKQCPISQSRYNGADANTADEHQ